MSHLRKLRNRDWSYCDWLDLRNCKFLRLFTEPVEGEPVSLGLTPDGDTSLSLLPSMSILVRESVSLSVSSADPVGDPFPWPDRVSGDPITLAPLGYTIEGFATLVTCLTEPPNSSSSWMNGLFSEEPDWSPFLLIFDCTLISLGVDDALLFLKKCSVRHIKKSTLYALLRKFHIASTLWDIFMRLCVWN